MHKPIIAAIVLASAYAVSNITEQSTPPVVMQPASPAPSVIVGTTGGAFSQPEERLLPDIPLTEAEFAELQERLRKEIEARKSPAPPSKEAQPQTVAQVAHMPAAGRFCVNGSCAAQSGVSAARTRRVVVQRPQRAGLFRGRIFGRR